MAESLPLGPDVEALRIARDRLGVGQLNEAWLEGLSDEVRVLLELGRKLDEMDLDKEEPA